MDRFSNYDISFSGLKQGEHIFDFEIKQGFFDLFSFEQEFSNPKIIATIYLKKHSSFLEVNVQIKGEMGLLCDISQEVYSQELSNKIKFLVKFGEEFDDSNEEILILPHGSYILNVGQSIFEAVFLSIPMKRLKPEYREEDYEDEFIQLLDKYTPEDKDFEN